MKKKAILRTLLGFPLGIFIGNTITILISVIAGDGRYYSVAPQFVEQAGSEVGAVILQYFMCGVLGATCAGGSCIFDMTEWSLLKQTIVHFIILVGSMFPIAWFSWWMPHSLLGAISYIGIFLAIYAVIFLIMFAFWKRKVKQMDAYIQSKKSNK